VDLSIVICTHNRCELLTDALTCLLAQETASIATEIIVVDNNSTDSTAEVVKRVVSTAGGTVRYCFEPSQGIAYARNTGWALAGAPIVAFTDDDVRVKPGWARQIHAAFLRHPEADCVGGKVLPLWPTQPPAWLTRAHWAPLATLDYGDSPLRLDRNDPRCLVGANFAVRRGALEQLGGFSPAVQRVKDGIGSIEDHEFLIRLWNGGGQALYLPGLVATAPVDPQRLEKRYHRRWHLGHGHFYAVMRSPRMEQSATGRLFDVPAHLYRQCLVDAAGWSRRMLRGQWNDAFLQEIRLRFFWGFFWKRLRDHLGASLPTGRRLRARVADGVHRIDARLARTHRVPRAVMFEAANPMLFNVFRPVYERLAADARIALTLVPNGREFTAAEIFAGASGRHRIVSPRRAAWMKPDVYINTDLWSMTWLRRRTRRVHLFHGVAGKYGLDAPTELAALVRTFDRILFPNRDRLERYVAAGLVETDGPVAALTGYPKADCLVDGSLRREEIAERLHLDAGKRTVVYAPTWSEHSSLSKAGEQIVDALADAGLNVIVKLHACSYTPRGSGGVDWRRRLGALAARRSNIFLVAEADASPYLVASDLLVTDHSTVGFEFMVLDRPVVVVHQPALIDRARINRDQVRRLQEAARVVDDVSDLAGAVHDELRYPERLSAARQRVARDLFYECGGATDRVMDVLYELLALPPLPSTSHIKALPGRGDAQDALFGRIATY
jgi:glycosyltransferase involved in cell wall biosynthesis